MLGMRVERRECANKFEGRSQIDTTVQAFGRSRQDFGDELGWKATHSSDERPIAPAKLSKFLWVRLKSDPQKITCPCLV